MTRNRIGKSALALALVVACGAPACDSGKTKSEEVTLVSGAATTNIAPGSLAVTCINSATDEVQIVSLVPLEAATDLKFSDNEWSGNGWVDLAETTDYAIPVPAAVAAGRQIQFVPGGGVPGTGQISNGPEQLFIYQGTAGTDAGASFPFIWGTQIVTGAAWGTAGSLATNVSALPSTLANANIALGISISNPTLWAYTGITTGTKAQLLAALQIAANWTGPALLADGGAAATCPGNFTVLPDATDAAADGSGGDVPADSRGSDTGTGAGGGTGGAGAGGASGSDGGGTVVDSGTGGAAVDSGTGDAAVVDAGPDATGTGGRIDAGPDVTGTGGMGTGGTGAGGVTGTGGRIDAGSDVTGVGGATVADAGSDVSPDTGTTTDAKADTGTTTDAKADTGTTPTDAKTDAKTDAAKDSVATGGGGGCGCSTASTRDGISTGAWMLALAGIIFTARRRRRR